MAPMLKTLMFLTDAGLLVYWIATALAALGLLPIPPEWLYPNSHDPAVVSWNWSFLPLDALVSGSGAYSLALAARGDAAWRRFAQASLAFTVCAGLMAISFWAIRREFDPAWWAPNLLLALWPMPYLACGFEPRKEIVL